MGGRWAPRMAVEQLANNTPISRRRAVEEPLWLHRLRFMVGSVLGGSLGYRWAWVSLGRVEKFQSLCGSLGWWVVPSRLYFGVSLVNSLRNPILVGVPERLHMLENARDYESV